MTRMNAVFRCLCMSPAIDATVALPRAPRGEGEIFKDVAEVENVGGKAVNVARWLALRARESAPGEAVPVACGGLLGEDNDRPFARELGKYGVEDRFVRVPGATRRNEMLTWPGGSVKLNRAAFPGLGNLPAGEGASLCDAVLSRLSEDGPAPGRAAVAVMSGSLPSAVGADFYAKAVARFKSLGWRTVLDASGEAMRLGLEAGPDLVKPNAEECEPLVGFVPRTRDGFVKATAALRAKAAHVIISDGGAGAWFDGEFVPAPKVDVVDTTAAGDTLLAEFCWRLYGEGDVAGAASWAVAAGSAACMMPGGAPPSAELVSRLR